MSDLRQRRTRLYRHETDHWLNPDRLPATDAAVEQEKSGYGHTHHVLTPDDIDHLRIGGLLIISDGEYTHTLELEPED